MFWKHKKNEFTYSRSYQCAPIIIGDLPSREPSPEPQHIMRFDIVTWGGDIVGHMVKCPLCEYTLTEEGVSKCPECGQELIWWEAEE